MLQIKILLKVVYLGKGKRGKKAYIGEWRKTPKESRKKRQIPVGHQDRRGAERKETETWRKGRGRKRFMSYFPTGWTFLHD